MSSDQKFMGTLSSAMLAMKMHSDNGACDSDDPRAKGVENTVYPARPLPKPVVVQNLSFSSDRARFMMVLKWMVFYKYIPGNAAELESPRAELRRQLGFSSPEYGAKLGWFLNRQFKAFKEQGLVMQKMDRQPAIYLKEAERWLSEDWNGEIRFGEDKQGAAQPSNSVITTKTPRKGHRKSITKRPAPGELTSRGKRHKTHSGSSEAGYERPAVLTNDANALITPARNQAGSPPIATAPRGAEPPLERDMYDEATLLKDCFVIYLFYDGLSRGEYRQYDGLVNQYDCGWSDDYLANSRPSEMLHSAYIQAQRELSGPDSPLKSRQYFEEFLNRWRGGRSEGQTLTTLPPMLSFQAQSTIQLQCVPLIPDLQNRGQYEE